MPQRFAHVLGNLADLGIVGTAIALNTALSSSNVPVINFDNPSTKIASYAALLIAIGKLSSYLSSSIVRVMKAQSEIKIAESFVDPEICAKLEHYKCYRAPGCDTRIHIKPISVKNDQQ
jgi:hypothetical protein